MPPTDTTSRSRQGVFIDTMSGLPWWFLIILLSALFLGYSFFIDETYSDIFRFLKDGIAMTIRVTLTGYALAVVIGLFTGLGRVSKNPIFYNLTTLYVNIMRGIPILVNILYVAFVVTPPAINGINLLGDWLTQIHLLAPENALSLLSVRQVDFSVRGTFALAISYGAFEAEIFRAGIESIGRGQMEAARSLGMSYVQAMRYIILPQAVRRVLPPLGNDFIAMLKESSLISVLGVRDMTQLSKLYAASSFQYLKTYTLLAFMYLTMTVLLSIGVKSMERRLSTDE